MRNFWMQTTAVVISASVFAVAGASAADPTPAAKPAGPGNRAQIEALEKGFAEAFNSKDADKVMSYYARDGLFVFDVIPPREHVGWEDYKKDWQGLFAAYPGPVTNDISELSASSPWSDRWPMDTASSPGS